MKGLCLHMHCLHAVSNHGVSEALVNDMFEQQRQIFALPTEEKMKLLQDANNRGYTPFRVRAAGSA